MRTVCKLDKCNGCYACVEKCPKSAIKVVDTMESVNAVIDEDVCINCHLCEKVCPNINPVPLKEPLEWKQGWSLDDEIRKNGSSGGVASALIESFIAHDGYVCVCKLSDGKFKFAITNSNDELDGVRGSKYVKSNPEGIYCKISELLKKGKKVLFIGLPCQVAGLYKYIGDYLTERLYTVDLICHGSPSISILNSFLKQYGDSIEDSSYIGFRSKNVNQTLEKRYSVGGTMDCYSLCFIYGLSYTRNCYTCNYASTKRCSDITLGDSWGSQLSMDERDRGISLVLCQSKKGQSLIENSNLYLQDVDIQIAIENNHQLKEPVRIPKGRSLLFKQLDDGACFNKATRKALPRQFYKQKIKAMLIKIGVLKSGGVHYSVCRQKISD